MDDDVLVGTLAKMTTGENNPLNNLLMSGKNQQLFGMIGSVTSLLNDQAAKNSSHLQSGDAEQLRKSRQQVNSKMRSS